jgi:hypothetical protein
MPDKDTINQVGAKFQAWAESLGSDEQAALASWWQQWSGNDVSGYSAGWWEQPGAWSSAWTESWSSWGE